MKALLQFIFPTLKAILGVVGFIIGMGWGAYGMVLAVAETQARVVEEKVMAVRNADFKHFDKRFDRLEQLIKETR